jgi:hypothetical protein
MHGVGKTTVRSGDSRWVLIAMTCSMVAVGRPGAASGQDARVGDADELTTAADVLRNIEPGTHLRIALRPRGHIEGAFLRSTSGVVRLRSLDHAVDVAVARIDSLWSKRSRTGRGAIVGGAIGAVTGVMITWRVSNALCDSTSGGCDPAPTHTWLLMIGGGGLVGSGIGLVLGAKSSRWELEFP